MNYFSYTQGNRYFVDAVPLLVTAKVEPLAPPVSDIPVTDISGGALINFKPDGDLFNIQYSHNKKKVKGGAVPKQDNIRFIM